MARTFRIVAQLRRDLDLLLTMVAIGCYKPNRDRNSNWSISARYYITDNIGGWLWQSYMNRWALTMRCLIHAIDFSNMLISLVTGNVLHQWILSAFKMIFYKTLYIDDYDRAFKNSIILYQE